MNKKYSLLAGFAGVLMTAALAQANASVTLSLQYLGAADAATYANMDVLGQNNDVSPFDGSISLPSVDFTNPANQNPNFTYYFTISVHFTSDASGEAFRDITNFNVVTGTGIQAVRPDAQPGNTPYYTAINANTGTAASPKLLFSTDSDSGANLDDLQVLDVQQSNGTGTTAGAYKTNWLVGTPGQSKLADPTVVGGFAIQFSGPLSANSFIDINPGSGPVFSYFTSSATGANVRIDPANGGGSNINGNGFDGVNPAVLNIAAAATPEPASLGVLALGGIALLARRRKNA